MQEISARHSSRMPCAFLLFPFLHSGVPPYADECKNEKSTYLFRPLPACRDFLDTLKGAQGLLFLFAISLHFCNIFILTRKNVNVIMINELEILYFQCCCNLISRQKGIQNVKNYYEYGPRLAVFQRRTGC